MSNEYEVIFKIGKIPLKRQNDIYNLLMKELSFEEKDNFSIKVIDSLNGIHDIFNNTGIAPDGNECRKCNMINCNHCYLWTRKEKNNER